MPHSGERSPQFAQVLERSELSLSSSLFLSLSLCLILSRMSELIFRVRRPESGVFRLQPVVPRIRCVQVEKKKQRM